MPTKQDSKNGEHTSDNQGLCWWCGCVVNQDWWDDYVGVAVDTPAAVDKMQSTLDRADAKAYIGATRHRPSIAAVSVMGGFLFGGAMQIKLVLDPGLHSQNKGHWRAKAALVKQARNSAAAQAKLQRVKLSGLVTVDYHFRVPDRRRRDLANMIHSCKPFIDGVVDAGAISGDHWEVLRIGEVTCEVVRTLVVCEVVLTFRGDR